MTLASRLTKARPARLLRRFWRARAGIAAVEFAFIMPMMLVLYFGLAVLGQGLEVGRKVQLASRTLADLTSQQLPAASGGTATGNCSTTGTTPCVSDADLTDFFTGAQLVMTPFDTTVMKATVSLAIFDNLTTTTTSGCCRARVVWSAGFGASPTLRACGPLSQSANGTNGATFMPVGNYPGAAGDPTQGGTYSVPVGTVNTTDYYLVIADVTYTFKPAYDFKLFSWNQNANGGAGYTISQTTYMTPRFGATNPINWTRASLTTFNQCVQGSGATNYNVP